MGLLYADYVVVVDRGFRVSLNRGNLVDCNDPAMTYYYVPCTSGAPWATTDKYLTLIGKFFHFDGTSAWWLLTSRPLFDAIRRS